VSEEYTILGEFTVIYRIQGITVIRDRQPLTVTPYRTRSRIIDFARNRLIMSIEQELRVAHNSPSIHPFRQFLPVYDLSVS